MLCATPDVHIYSASVQQKDTTKTQFSETEGTTALQ